MSRAKPLRFGPILSKPKFGGNCPPAARPVGFPFMTQAANWYTNSRLPFMSVGGKFRVGLQDCTRPSGAAMARFLFDLNFWCCGSTSCTNALEKSAHSPLNSTYSERGPCVTSQWRELNFRQRAHDVSKTEHLDWLGRVVDCYYRLSVND